jgi:hypothetical protein
METNNIPLTDHEVDVILNALDIASENADEYDKSEYEEVLYSMQKKLDEDLDDELE